jgi:hypothetical protein
MGRSLVQKLLLGVVFGLGLAGCKLALPNFVPTSEVKAYQKEETEYNPVLVVSSDGNDLNGKADIVNYHLNIKDADGRLVESITQDTPISMEIPMEDGTFYISGGCSDLRGASDDDGPIEVIIARGNHLPTANLSVSPNSGKPPLEVSIAFDGTDEDGVEDIVEYQIEIDKGRDGTIDETITGNSPINIYREFSTNSDIYGKVNDAKGATSSVGPVKVTVDETPVPNPPIPVFSISAPEGNTALETLLLSINGIKTDAEISDYKVWFDANNNLQRESNEIIMNSMTAIENKSIVVTEAGTKRFYGICTDINGLEGITRLAEVFVNPASQITDMTGSVILPDAPYSVGGKLTFAAEARNNKNPLSPITIDNSNHQSLRYKILRKIGQGIYEEILNKKLENEVNIILNPAGVDGIVNPGSIRVEQKSDEKMYFEIKNARVTFNGLTLTFKDSPAQYIESSSNHLFDKAGDYIFQTIMRYSLGDEPQTRTFNFVSSDFVVQP